MNKECLKNHGKGGILPYMQDFTPDMLRRETVRLALEKAEAVKRPAEKRRRQEQALTLAASLKVPVTIQLA